GNSQTRVVFEAEAAAIVARQPRLTWLAPSRDENAAAGPLEVEAVETWVGAAADQPRGPEATVAVQGGRERGLILHKLIEEVLTGQPCETRPAPTERAGEPTRAFGQAPADNPAAGLSPEELAGSVVRTLALPEIVALRPGLLAEFPVYAIRTAEDGETAIAG